MTQHGTIEIHADGGDVVLELRCKEDPNYIVSLELTPRQVVRLVGRLVETAKQALHSGKGKAA